MNHTRTTPDQPILPLHPRQHPIRLSPSSTPCSQGPFAATACALTLAIAAALNKLALVCFTSGPCPWPLPAPLVFVDTDPVDGAADLGTRSGAAADADDDRDRLCPAAQSCIDADDPLASGPAREVDAREVFFDAEAEAVVAEGREEKVGPAEVLGRGAVRNMAVLLSLGTYTVSMTCTFVRARTYRTLRSPWAGGSALMMRPPRPP